MAGAAAVVKVVAMSRTADATMALIFMLYITVSFKIQTSSTRSIERLCSAPLVLPGESSISIFFAVT
jgi:hypothetical protein